MSEGDSAVGYRRFDCNDGDPVVVEEAAESARQAIERGACIVLPTDTVYGIGADAFSAEAVQGLLDAKNRGRDMPPPVLIADASLLRALTVDVPQSARDLVQRHWPGALTIICKAQPSLRMDLGETEGTIALRVPDHALARDVLRRTGPMAVSSANISGQKAAVTCDQAVDQLGDRVAVYLDGGALPWHGEPSTIVDFASSPDGIVLRKGALSVAEIRQVCPAVVDPDEPQSEPSPERPADDASGDPAVQSASDDAAAEQTSGGPATDDGSAQTAQVWSKDAGYHSSTADSDDRFHEPTTDELRITHPVEDPDQPSLFERSDDSIAPYPDPVAPEPMAPEPIAPEPIAPEPIAPEHSQDPPRTPEN